MSSLLRERRLRAKGHKVEYSVGPPLRCPETGGHIINYRRPTKANSKSFHVSRSCATACQTPLLKPACFSKNSSNSSAHLLRVLPTLRCPCTDCHDNSSEAHLQSSRLAKWPAQRHFLRLIDVAQAPPRVQLFGLSSPPMVPYALLLRICFWLFVIGL